MEEDNIVKEENALIEDKSGKVSEEEIIRIRKDKIVKFFKTNYNWITYVVLAFIVYLAVKIRTSNLVGLKDITTGTWTLGPDLDPFLFLRWAKYIFEHGSIMANDAMRYVPLGYDTRGEMMLLSYMIVWFHKIAAYFGSTSITQSAVLFPVFMFGLTIIAFFFMTRKIFLKSLGEKIANIIALISSFFLSVMPSLLPRTIAGIPEKESAAFLFMFLTFYFFLCAWESDKKYGKYVYAVLAGISTGTMALIWGGIVFIFLTIGPAVFIAFLLGSVDKKRLYVYGIWILSSFMLMHPFSTRYSYKDLFTSIDTGAVFLVFLIIAFHIFVFEVKLKHNPKVKKLHKIPPQLLSAAIIIIVGFVLVSLFFGPSDLASKFSAVKDTLIKPATSRLIQTVAENRQPYFNEWSSSFGPQIRGIPLTFWLFFVGSVYLFYNAISTVKNKDRIVLTLSYLGFLLALIFSRYAPDKVLNGTNFQSLFIYALGFIVFIGVIGYYYYQYHKNKEEEKLKKIEFSFILIFSLFFLSLVAARASVRTIMVLVPAASIIVAYLNVVFFNYTIRIKKENLKVIALAFSVIIIISTVFSGYSFYKSVSAEAQVYVPSIYTQQWQKAMAWVRENTPENAVFGHWWDYGYWLQSIGERATVLDGGNALSYWNHLMGRYALTGTSDKDALEFLYAHNTTHFLIDSTDIGKYSAFSTIGGDINYDRASFISTFYKDVNQVQEKKNSTVFVYAGGIGLDADIVYQENGTRIFLPSGQAGLGGVLVEKDKNGAMVTQPKGVFVYQGRQYQIPFRYAYYNKKFVDFGTGLESGIFIYPRFAQSQQGALQVDIDGAMLYLSKRTVKSQLARLYLYKENDTYFKLVHSEDDFFVANVKSQNPNFDYDIVDYGGVRGPIRIWEIKYPKDIEFKEEYLSTYYPPELLYGK